MKAERRHELKTNALARGIENLPQLWRQHGNKLLLVLIGIMLIIIAVRYRMTESAQRQLSAKSALTKAQAEIAELRAVPFWLYNEDVIVSVFSQQAGFADDDINEALRSADDSQVRAQAYVARGDLNFLWAGFPILPAATTRPSLRPPHSSEEYLNNAEAAYNQALKEPVTGDRQVVWNAHLGLAYVAEDRRDWDAARSNYDAVINDPSAPTAMTEFFKKRKSDLVEMSRKRFVGLPMTEPASPASTLPSVFGPAAPETEPATTQPSTRPAEPITAPSAAPQTPTTSPATSKSS